MSRAGHVVFVKFGEYGAAVKRFAQGGSENYYAQRYSVEYVGSLVTRCDRVTVVNLTADQATELLPNGVHTLGVELYRPGASPRFRELIAELARLRPDHLVLSAPLAPVLAWALRAPFATLPMFFDSFRARGLRARYRYWRLARLLKSPRLRWVTNHGVAAAKDLVRIGVPAAKVLPIDWPAFDSPEGRPAKTLRGGPGFDVVFVGMVSAAKGARDLLLAVDMLNQGSTGREYRVTFIGRVEGDDLPKLAQRAAFPERIRFAGMVPHEEIVPRMQAHDAVVVPSRHEYPEGLPMTIYEAFCSRTPLIASDHPMFLEKTTDGYNCVRFEAGSVAALAAAIRRLGEDGELYSSLSRNSAEAAARHFCPLKYHQVVESWLDGSPEAMAFLASHSLAAQGST